MTMKNFILFVSLLLSAACQKTVDLVPVQKVQLPASTTLDVAYGADPKQKMDIYLPAGRHSDSTKLMVLVHGGAWIGGDKSEFGALVLVLQQRFPNYAIANINYRLAVLTANHFPAQENDMKSAVGYLLQKSKELQVSRKIVLLGASAGAHMALLQAYKQHDPGIKAVVDFFGPPDMTQLYSSVTNENQKFAMQVLVGGTPASHPNLYYQSSPLSFVSAAAPPTIIFHGDRDELVPVDHSRQLKQKLDEARVINQLVIYPNQGHDLWPPLIMADAFSKMDIFLKSNVR